MRPILSIPLSYLCYLWFISCYLLHCCPMAKSEFYSSVDSLKILGSMEATLIDIYRQNLQVQKQDIESVQRFIKDVKFQHALAEEDIPDYIENPIKSFQLIKRMVNDWKELFEFLQFRNVKMDMDESLTQLGSKLQLLNDNELKGAIRGLMRLQTIYKLSANEMANGEKYGNSLDWNDCFEIGATLVDDQNYHLGVDWLMLSLPKLQASEESNNIKLAYTTQIKEYLALAYQGLGKYETAIQHLDDIIENNADSNAKLTKNLLLNTEIYYGEDDDDDDITAKFEKSDDYARLCRGEKRKELHQLNCELDTKFHPIFILCPLKIEHILLNPPITLYHNLINDKQISELLRLTHDKMNRSTVVYNNQSVKMESRVSQQAWIDRKQSNIANMIYRTVGAITGLDMSNAEHMQVANYGIAGQYEEHFDFLGEGYKTVYVGNRIATNMFYLSDVDEGGYTVFPQLDVYTKPVKGSMVMWYNLHKSLNEDRRTLHAGCPVLKGSKMIANIWTHSGFQEFRRPCDLIDDSIY